MGKVLNSIEFYDERITEIKKYIKELEEERETIVDKINVLQEKESLMKLWGERSHQTQTSKKLIDWDERGWELFKSCLSNIDINDDSMTCYNNRQNQIKKAIKLTDEAIFQYKKGNHYYEKN